MIIKRLRRFRRAVWFHEAATHEKWLVLVVPQILDRAVGGFVVAVFLALALQHDPLVGLAVADVGRDFHDFIRIDFRGLHRRIYTNSGERARLSIDTPRFGVVDATVENFTNANRGVAVVFEMPGQANKLRVCVAKPSAVAKDAGGARIATR